MRKKKIGVILGTVAVLAAVGAGGWYLYGKFYKNAAKSCEDKVYVESVAKIMQTATGANNRYSGVVEPQDTWEVNLDTSRKLLEVYVEEGTAASNRYCCCCKTSKSPNLSVCSPYRSLQLFPARSGSHLLWNGR